MVVCPSCARYVTCQTSARVEVQMHGDGTTSNLISREVAHECNPRQRAYGEGPVDEHREPREDE